MRNKLNKKWAIFFLGDTTPFLYTSYYYEFGKNANSKW